MSQVEEEIKSLQRVQQEKVARMNASFNEQLEAHRKEMENMDIEFLKAQTSLQKENEQVHLQLQE